MDSDDSQPTPAHARSSGVGRRALLASGATALVGSGCIQRTQSLVGRSTPNQVSLTIKTVPADTDARATAIARHLSDQLTAVGIDARIALRSREELYRDILLNQQFDLYVATYPHVPDPDFLRPLLHSRFGGEPGWQNPFGYTNLELDEQLEAQRTESGTARTEILRGIERTVVRDQPFTVVAFPEVIRTAHAGRLRAPEPNAVHTALRYLAVEPTADQSIAGTERANRTDDGASVEGETATATETETTTATETGPNAANRLRVTTTDSRATKNQNPLAVEFRSGSTITALVYDALGRWRSGRVRPWLATDWEWTTSPTADGPRARVTIRDDARWHDGTAVTADDVAFTYRFLRDTSLGRAESPVPAPTYRGETSLVESVAVRAEDRVELQFRPVSRSVATRVFTVPVLPEHTWRDRSGPATIAGVDTGSAVTEALVWNDGHPVGSGPLRVDGATAKESLDLRRVDDHFLTTATADEFGRYAGGFAFDRLQFVVAPSTAAAAKLVGNGTADMTGSPLSQRDVPRIGRNDALELRVSRPYAFYHVGYNARSAPTSNTRFRRAVARLVDKATVVDEFFRGYADPAASPLARRSIQSRELQWEGRDPAMPFVGDGGTLDIDRARDLFREAGYRYSTDGDLLGR